jgi:hypothetical protein
MHRPKRKCLISCLFNLNIYSVLFSYTLIILLTDFFVEQSHRNFRKNISVYFRQSEKLFFPEIYRLRLPFC